MAGNTAVSVEALDRLERLFRERFDEFVTLHASERDGIAKALLLQASEYERRLEGLNHENARIQKILELAVSRISFDDYVKTEQQAKALARDQLQGWKDSVNAALSTNAATARTWTAAVGVVLALLGLLLRYAGGGASSP